MLVAYAIRHWALAAAVFFGCTGGLFAVSQTGGGAIFLAPFLSGAALASMVIFVFLRIRPDSSLWSKSTITLAVTFAAHFAFFSYVYSS